MPDTDRNIKQTTAWCPGCGNFAILKSLNKALDELNLKPHEVMLASGIGQAAKLPHYTKGHTFNGLHGRSLPNATGIRLANNTMPLINITGDGDCYGEGGNHFIHTIRRNPNIAHLVHNNQIYALTKGQASPTTAHGTVSKFQPGGNASEPLNPIALAVSLNASFVARGFAGDQGQLVGLIKAAITHKGYALIDILQPCVSFNKINTYQWYKERVYELEAGYDPTDRVEAFRRALEWGDRIPTGVFYKINRPILEDNFEVIKDTPLYKQTFSKQKAIDTINSLFEF